jgi:CRISPR system Cascade subunit CasA
MNLISERWIPVRHADGSHERIAPWQLTDGIGDKRILAVASPRPDFDGALTQFLIGLLQTTCTPTEEQWWDWREAPPSPEVLKERFATVAHAFELEGEKAFMQERLSDKAEDHPVTYLLIGAPTDSTLDQNTDHFQKRPRGGECLCRACAAAATYTLQTFAPSGGGGGDGKFTSLRGGGPLTTLMLGGNLWETVWLNVVYGATFSRRSPDHKTFPWLNVGAFITQARPVKTIHSVDMNPEHVFWGMPRRIQLDLTASDGVPDYERSRCAVCGEVDDRICIGYHDLTGGQSYQEKYIEKDKKGKDVEKKRPSWLDPKHPLSPYTINNKGEPVAVHPQPGGIGFRHWLGLVENSQEGDNKRIPAKVIEQFRNSYSDEDGQLWAFGFDMDNMKARCWYDATMPILSVQKELKVLFCDIASRMVKAAKQVAGDLSKFLKAALFNEKSKVRSDDLGFIQDDFWYATESPFYDHLRQLRVALPADPLAHSVLESWLKALRAAAFSVFDSHSQTGDFDAVDPRRVALARNGLGKALAGAPLKEKILGLPKPPKPVRKQP